MLAKLKNIVAERLGISRLNAAVEHLLVRDLNLHSVPAEGAAGNRVLRDAFFHMIPILQPTIFCDIGANDGSIALSVRDLAPECAVIGFEANPRIHAKHATTMTARGIEWLNIAVADCSGRLPIFVPLTLSRAYVDGKLVPMTVIESEDTGKSSLLHRDEDATYESFEVDAVTLDDFFRNRPARLEERRCFLWIDVEGAADKVLAGADEVLDHTLAIFIETENFDFWKGQKRAGEILSLLYRKGFLPVARDREYGDKQFNMLFVAAGVASALRSSTFDASSQLRACLVQPPPGQAKSSTTPPAVPVRRYATVNGWLQSEIPVLVPCFNNPTYSRSILHQLEALGFQRITFVDNASTSADMRVWLESLGNEATFVALGENSGSRQACMNPRSLALLPQRFCITDAELAFNPALPDGFMADLAILIERHRVGKAGFALDISDRDKMQDKSFRAGGRDWKIWEWEAQFWKERLADLDGGDPVYAAPIDTTFALYDKTYFDPADFTRAVRVAGRFTARHLPWYRDTGLSGTEADFSRQAETFSDDMKNEPKRP